jgi:hypothetical protein
MGAVKATCPIGEAGILAAGAGHDLILVCHDLQAQKDVFYHLLEAYRGGRLPLKELEESAARIKRLKRKRTRRFAKGEAVPEPEGAALAAQICRESVRVIQDRMKLLPLQSADQGLAVIFPRFSALDARIMIEKEVLAEKDFIRREFNKFGHNPEVHLVSIEPAEEEIQQAVSLARKADLTIFFCYDAHLYPSNQKLLMALQDAADRLAVDLLRDPYDAEFLKEGTAGLTDFGWRICQIKAAIAKMCSS